MKKYSHIFGVILVFLGFIFLMKNLGILTAPLWGVLWPLIFIIVGAVLLRKQYEHALSKWCPACVEWLKEEKEKKS